MPMRAVWAEVDLNALESNIKNIKSCINGNTKWCAVVKADAYGHGALAVARKCVEMGASYLAVAVLSEAVALRKAGFTTPIIILGASPIDTSGMLVDYDITQAVFEFEQAEAISRQAVLRNKTAKIHLKIDTGMHRIGIKPDEAGEMAKKIADLPGIKLEGMFSHFALADNEDKTYSYKQLDSFKRAIEQVEAAGINIELKHIANSAALLEMPETHFDMVRAGIILYGLWPSEEVNRSIELKPLMKLCAKVAFLKELEVGDSVSYGCTWTAERKSLIGTLPIGYADGYTRMLSGKAEIDYNGRRAPIAGRICMDQCMVDFTGIKGIKEGDTVVLYGSDALAMDEVASWLGTINYELPCMLSPRVPRVYKG
ncbi:alanine racemase [Anaerovibrio lipolyticus]|uniref:alanine racemase n=1 Tax=Anaerovibrio lipolyticus TaxID=82374 RepID=UPI0026E98C09|nr:alanine racemase [Anaerovibrio lipolyticus]MBE6104864.1 alanine racemase [Anaerovibrio lipolyticus]